MRAVINIVLGGVFALAISGCNGGEQLVTVSGRVTLDGAPLTDSQVIFYPIEGDNERAFIGFADQDGKFQLGQAGADSAGVPPGKYRVSISTAVIKGTFDELTPIPPERVPQKYRDNPLEFEVPADGTTEANFSLES